VRVYVARLSQLVKTKDSLPFSARRPLALATGRMSTIVIRDMKFGIVHNYGTNDNPENYTLIPLILNPEDTSNTTYDEDNDVPIKLLSVDDVCLHKVEIVMSELRETLAYLLSYAIEARKADLVDTDFFGPETQEEFARMVEIAPLAMKVVEILPELIEVINPNEINDKKLLESLDNLTRYAIVLSRKK